MRFFLKITFFAVLIAAGAAFVWGNAQLQKPFNMSAPTAMFEVKKGSSFRTVILELKNRGWIEETLPARIWARYNPLASQIKAGEYEVVAGTNLVSFLHQLIDGQVVHYSVTLVEGKTFKDFLKKLSTTDYLDKKLKDKTTAEIMQLVAGKDEYPEGLFFPDTYQYSKGDSDLDILRRAYQRMQKVLAEEWAQRSEGLPIKSSYEALILASIVEKETGLASERPDIAGVFVRRLQKKMRLQTDPTVIYGLGDAYKGNITRKHLKTTTPYNTYRIKGLPPTPIAMPGREAINAALHPKAGETLYFVAKGDGSHYFSKTNAEHNAAVKKYQWKRVNNYRSSPQ